MANRSDCTCTIFPFTAALLMAIPSAVLAAPEEPTSAAILQRLEALEAQNQELVRQLEELRKGKEARDPRGQSPDATHTSSATKARQDTGADDWPSRIRLNGDFRFRHENIDDAAAQDDRTRETIRARFNAAIDISDSIRAEIGFASGGRDPRGSSSTLGATSSRKETGLDLAYVTWRPKQSLAVTAGKMRQTFVRPGLSAFIDNEIRPEGLAVNYRGASGLFATGFHYWLEERPQEGDSTLLGGQVGWGGELAHATLQLGAGYYDFRGVQGRVSSFGGGLLHEQGNSVIDSGGTPVYRYDYDVEQLFAQLDFVCAGVPVELFADYAHNPAAEGGLDTAYNVGFLVGKARHPGHWEVGMFRQKVEKDAWFGQWIDSDFAGGLTDNEGYVYRLARMMSKHVLVNLTYLDTAYDVERGNEADYKRWQLDFNFTF
jgi:hypothetical protein